MKRYRKTAGVLAMALSPALAQAGDAYDLDEAYDLGEITLFANQGETEVERSGSTVEIATKEQIQASSEVRVADFLDSLPGISVSTSGGFGTVTSLRLRGAPGQYLGVYVDGINVNDPSAPQTAFDFGSLMTSDVSRIEVLKGAQSALYGSEAIGGVINITSNRATEAGVVHFFDLEYGSHDTRRASYNFSALGARGELAFTLSHIKSDGFSAADENAGNTEADGYEARRLSFSGAYDLTDTVRVGMSGFYQDSTVQYDEFAFGIGPVDGTPDETSDSTTRALRVFAKIDGAMIRHNISASIFEIDRAIHGSNAWGPFFFDHLGQRTTFAYNGSADLSDRLTLVLGTDYSDESYRSGATSADHRMHGIFGELQYAPNHQLDLVASLRNDHHSEFGGKTTGRMAVAYRPRQDLILRIAGGTGFRAPSLNELFGPFGSDPTLQPETAKTVDLGVEKRFAGGAFSRVTLFRTEITDLITYVWPAGYAQTPGTSRMQGAVLSGMVPFSDQVQLAGSLTYTEAHDQTGARLNRVPETELELRLSADITDRLRGMLSAQNVTGLLDSGTSIPDYTVVRLKMAYQLSDNTEVYARVENLFDREHQTIRGYGQSDRAFYVGLRARF